MLPDFVLHDDMLTFLQDPSTISFSETHESSRHPQNLFVTYLEIRFTRQLAQMVTIHTCREGWRGVREGFPGSNLVWCCSG
jgi:hypothetical protein